MKKTFDRQIAYFVLFALLAPAWPPSPRSAARATALPSAALTAADPKTELRIHPLSTPTGAVLGSTDGHTWAGNTSGNNYWATSVPGYNLARQFNNSSNQSFLLLLNGNTGKALTYRLEANGGLGAVTWQSTGNPGGVISQPGGLQQVPQLRCSAAEFVRLSGVTYLITHDSFTGRVRTFHMYENGAVNLGTMQESTLASWKDKSLFSLYYYNGAYYLFGLDTWTGATVAYSIAGQKIGEATGSRGWTSVDHLAIGGATYRALYKAAGDPHKKAGETGDHLGTFAIQIVAANGVEGPSLYTASLGENWSSVRFVPLYNGQGFNHALFFYNRATGQYRVRAFNPQSGLGAELAAGNHSSQWSDVEPYTYGTQTCLAFLNADNAAPFYFNEAEKMGQVIHEALQDKTVGYQFMLAQSGRVIYSRGWGQAALAADPDDDEEMTTRRRLDIGSVSKMITTMTVMKMASAGNLSLDDHISEHLPASDFPANSWVTQRTVADLLKHTTGMRDEADENDDKCVHAEGYYGSDCTPFYATAPTGDCNAAGCARKYNNSNISVAGKVTEYINGIQATPDVVAKTHQLWGHDLGLNLFDEMTCQITSNDYYFGRCEEGNDCFNRNGKFWLQGKFGDPGQTWTNVCSAGGWRAASRQLIEFLAAIRYEKVLPHQMNEELLRTDLEDTYGNATALGWEPAWDTKYGSGQDWQLHKNGSLTRYGVGTRAYITRLPNNCDAVLQVNSSTPGPDGLLKGAFYHVKFDAPEPNFVQIVSTGSEEDEASTGAIDRLAINTIATGVPVQSGGEAHYITAARTGDSKLKLTGWHVRNDGSVEREGDTIGTATIKDLAITDGAAFVTATIASDDRLKVAAWSVTGGDADQIFSEGTATGDKVTKVAAAKLAGNGTQSGRVVTAARNLAGNLQLDVWDFNNLTNTVTHRDKWEAGAISEVAARTIRYQTSLTEETRLVTAVRNGQGKMQVDAWEVDGAGQIERLGGEQSPLTVKGGDLGGIGSGSSYPSRSKIAIGSWGVEKFFVAFLRGDDKLQLKTWSVDTVTGAVTNMGAPGEAATSYTKTEVALSGTTIVLRDHEGNLLLVRYGITREGEITEKGHTDGGAIKLVAAAGRVLTAYSLGADGKLKLRNWDVLD